MSSVSRKNIKIPCYNMKNTMKQRDMFKFINDNYQEITYYFML